MVELKSGDLCIPGSDRFADYRDQLVSWDEYHRDIAAYGEMIGLPIEGAAFVAHMKARLSGGRPGDGPGLSRQCRPAHRERRAHLTPAREGACGRGIARL